MLHAIRLLLIDVTPCHYADTIDATYYDTPLLPPLYAATRHAMIATPLLHITFFIAPRRYITAHRRCHVFHDTFQSFFFFFDIHADADAATRHMPCCFLLHAVMLLPLAMLITRAPLYAPCAPRIFRFHDYCHAAFRAILFLTLIRFTLR